MRALLLATFMIALVRTATGADLAVGGGEQVAAVREQPFFTFNFDFHPFGPPAPPQVVYDRLGHPHHWDPRLRRYQ
jgi:hypothetical protein